MHKLLPLALDQFRDRHAGFLRNHLGDVLLAYFLTEQHGLLRARAGGFEFRKLLFKCWKFSIAELGCSFELSSPLRPLGLKLYLFDLLLKMADLIDEEILEELLAESRKEPTIKP
jgi:hypothetical protein